MKNRIPSFILIGFGLLFACEGQRHLAGEYAADLGTPSARVHLVLREDGTGEWSAETNRAEFKWEVRGTHIWIHTATGGVMEGEITGQDIVVRLPGETQPVTFVKSRTHH
jgi:hypothetical protein